MQINSNVQGSRKFLNTVQERIPLSDGLGEELLLAVGSIALNYTLNFIDLAVDLSVIDKVAQFRVKEVLGHTESPRHVFNGD